MLSMMELVEKLNILSIQTLDCRVSAEAIYGRSLKICEECMQVYYSHQKDLDKTREVIQNRFRFMICEDDFAVLVAIGVVRARMPAEWWEAEHCFSLLLTLEEEILTIRLKRLSDLKSLCHCKSKQFER